jgi:putative holliday junction resolvase
VAIAIPCHRVVGKDGNAGGYRWGDERKRTLLDKEKEGVSLPSRGNPGPDPRSTGRILAIDFGLVCIGLAVSDSLGITAQGLATLERRNKQTDFRTIGELANEYSVARIIVGNPIGLSSEETEMSRRIARFADELGSRLDIPVELWDERFSSAEADRSLREAGADGRKRRQARDRVAAQILLQSYLDRRAFEREHLGS